MQNFRRVIALSFRQRVTFVLSIFCALGVATLWGGNIGAIYPLVEMVLNGKSAPAWIEEQIKAAETTTAELTTKLAAADQSPADLPAISEPPAGQSTAQLSRDRQRLESEQEALSWYRAVQPYVNQYAPIDAFTTLIWICTFILSGTVLKNLFRIGHSILVARLAHLTSFELRKQFFRRTLRLDLASFGEHRRGDILTRFTADLQGITAGVQLLFGLSVREPLKAVVCLAGAAYISWQLLLLTLVVAPLAGYLISRLAKSLKRANRRALTDLSGMNDTLTETFRGMKAIKAFTMESQVRGRFHQACKEFYHKVMKIARYSALASPLTETMGMIMITVGILAGGYLALEQTNYLWFIKISDRPLGAGSLMLFFAFLVGASDPARRLSHVFNQLQQALAASDRVYEMMDREPAIEDPPHPLPVPKPWKKLSLERVTFDYQPGTRVLHEVDLTIHAGETVAIVGPNGCGKSTLLSLVPRFFDPIAGAVTLDGIDLRNMRVRDIRRRIGLVTQETLLFNESIIDNIRFGSPDATDAEVFAAAKQAHAHEFVTKKLDAGYQTLAGPGGNRLSGGQRQRITLARAILRDPDVLLLDEATSQIDVESEQLIHKVLNEFTKGRTTLLITHRPSTLAIADRVVVMDHGRIVDIGTQSELSARCQLYQKLCQSPLRESA